MSLYDTPESVRGLRELDNDGRAVTAARLSELPARYSPKVAGHARGPFLEPTLITPSDWLWRNARTYVVRCALDGLDYRALRVSVNGQTVGWWAVELLGTPLSALELPA